MKQYHKIFVKSDRSMKARMWIQENFGPSKAPSSPWSSMKWYGKAVRKKGKVVGYRFYFVKQEQATLFALRWAS